MPLGAVTLLAGRQGLGKSTLLADITARLTRGTLTGDQHGQPTAVLIASYEDTYESTTVPRLLAAGADLDLAVGLDLLEDGRPGLLSLPGDLDLIACTARQYKAGALLIDPLMAGLSGGVDSHRDQDVRRALAPLGQLAVDADLAILAVLHLRKGTASEALDRISGSVAFTAAARSVLAFGRGNEEEEDGPSRLLAHAKSNLGPLAPSLAYQVEPETVRHGDLDISTSRLVSKGECEVGAGELLSPPPAEDRSEIEIAAEWLADELADGEWHGSREVKASAKAADIRVDLPVGLREELTTWRARSPRTRPSDPVFICRRPRDGRRGRQTPRNVQARFATAVKAANAKLRELGIEPIGKVSPHSLRRTYANLRAALRDDPIYIAEQLGHRDARFTFRVYQRAAKRREKLSSRYLEAFDAACEWAQMGTKGTPATGSLDFAPLGGSPEGPLASQNRT